MAKHQKILKAEELRLLHRDIRERLRLRRILSDTSYDVLEAELGVSKTTIRRVEKPGYEISGLCLIDVQVLSEIGRRRKAYWLTREVYDDRYTTEQLTTRYGISTRTLMAHIRQVKRQLLQERKTGERIQHKEAA